MKKFLLIWLMLIAKPVFAVHGVTFYDQNTTNYVQLLAPNNIPSPYVLILSPTPGMPGQLFAIQSVAGSTLTLTYATAQGIGGVPLIPSTYTWSLPYGVSVSTLTLNGINITTNTWPLLGSTQSWTGGNNFSSATIINLSISSSGFILNGVMVTTNSFSSGGPGLASTQTWTGINTFTNEIISSATISTFTSTNEKIAMSTMTNLNVAVLQSTQPMLTNGFPVNQALYSYSGTISQVFTAMASPVGTVAITLPSSGTWEVMGGGVINVSNCYVTAGTTITFKISETYNGHGDVTNATWNAIPMLSPSNNSGVTYALWSPLTQPATYTTTGTTDVLKLEELYSGGGFSGSLYTIYGWLRALRLK